MKITTERIILVLLLVSASLLYYRVVLFTPLQFGDETYWADYASRTFDGGIYPTIRSWNGSTDIYHTVNTEQPLYILVMSMVWLLGEFGFKLFLPIFTLLSAIAVYVLFERHYSGYHGLAAAIALLMTPAMVTYGVLMYVDTLLALLFVMFAWFLLEAVEKHGKKYFVTAGVIAGLAILTKTTGLGVLLIAAIFFIYKKVNYRNAVLFFVVALLVVSPFITRNLILFGSPCYKPLESSSCGAYSDIEVEKLGFPSLAPPSGSTGDNLLKFGLLNFSDFAFGIVASAAFLIGIAFAFTKKTDLSILLILWTLIISGGILSQGTYTGRTEDFARYLVPVVPALAGFAALFLGDTTVVLNKKHFVLGMAFILLFSSLFWVFGQAKLDTMSGVKQFVPSFFEGCDWISKNTPQDSLIMSLWGNAYHCKRDAAWSSMTDSPEIILSNNDTSYEHLKLNGFDYVFIQLFAVQQTPETGSIPAGFVNYMSGSPHFEKVYDNTDRYGNNGVLVYRVL